VLDEIRGIFGLRVKGAAPVATVVVGLTRRTPLGSDLDVTTVRAAQEAVVAGLQNAAFVDTDRLQMEMGIGAPRVVRQQNGIHWTPIAQRTLGFMIDQAAGTLAGIPAHPDGDAAVDFGAVDGGMVPVSADDGGESEEGAPTGSGSTESAAGLLTPTSTQQQELQTALFQSPDVAAYTTPAGLSVTRRSISDMLLLEEAAREAAQRRHRIRNVLVRFE
jgi:hypothetical protein